MKKLQQLANHYQFSPLSYRARPQSAEEFINFQQLQEEYSFLNKRPLSSFVMWGPPGCGKTSLANLLSSLGKQEFFAFSAVLGSVSELKKLMEECKKYLQWGEAPAIIFIDEIHRFNRAQQDALLPYVEAGYFTFIGATTENPRYVINKALLSRLQIVELKKLESESILTIINTTIANQQLPTFPQEVLSLIAEESDGDARKALNNLEILLNKYSASPSPTTPTTTTTTFTLSQLDNIKRMISHNNRNYDRKQNRHYDVISAFIKSMRGSDPDAAILWLSVMIDGGEDPVFIARRLVIFASEDVGNADPMGLVLATAALTAVEKIGLPEAKINLAQVTTYLASTVKSNAAYLAISRAEEVVANNPTIAVPPHLTSASKNYIYPHNYSSNFVTQNYSSIPLPPLYQPADSGREKFLKERLKALWGDRLNEGIQGKKGFEEKGFS